MLAYLITAPPGTGKSTIVHELARRGYAAYDTDDVPNASAFVERATGRIVPHPGNPIDWTTYDFRWQPAKIHELLASGNPVFLGAIVGNQQDFYRYFKTIFVLTIDEATLRHRILTRTSHNYGKHPDELQGVLARRAQRQAELLSNSKAVAIDATPPVPQVADAILDQLHLPHSR